jgi:hypothetical protein
LVGRMGQETRGLSKPTLRSLVRTAMVSDEVPSSPGWRGHPWSLITNQLATFTSLSTTDIC